MQQWCDRNVPKKAWSPRSCFAVVSAFCVVRFLRAVSESAAREKRPSPKRNILSRDGDGASGDRSPNIRVLPGLIIAKLFKRVVMDHVPYSGHIIHHNGGTLKSNSLQGLVP